MIIVMIILIVVLIVKGIVNITTYKWKADYLAARIADEILDALDEREEENIYYKEQ